MRAALGARIRLIRCATKEVAMPRKSPFDTILSEKERTELSRRAHKYTYFMVSRAKMILLAAEGLENDEIALRLNTTRKIVSRWRKHFFEERISGLEERPRPGRPPVFPPRAAYPH